MKMLTKWLQAIRKRWYQYRYRFVPWIIVNLKDRRVREIPIGSTKAIEVDKALCDLQKYFHLIDKNDKYNTGMSTNVLHKAFGFSINRSRSKIAGTGVFVSSGVIKKGSLVALYPGTVYHSYEPIFFQSLANPFIFRCVDGVLIDGKDTGISNKIYRSYHPQEQPISDSYLQIPKMKSHLKNPRYELRKQEKFIK